MKTKPKIFGKTLLFFTTALVFANCPTAEAQEAPQSTEKARYLEQLKKWGSGMGTILADMGPRSNIGEERFRKMDELDKEVFLPLGSQALTYIVPQEQVNSWIGGAFATISKFTPHNVLLKKEPRNLLSTTEEFPELIEKDTIWDARKIYLKWWLDGKERTPQWFGERYPNWLALRRQGKTAEAAEMYQKLLDIGLPAIPLWLEKLEVKPDAPTQQTITEAISSLTDGAIKSGLPVASYTQWWKTDAQKWTVPFPQSRASYIAWLQKEAATNDGLGVAYATTIGHIEDPSTIPALIGLLRHPNAAVRSVALEQLQKLVGEALPEPYQLPAAGAWETRSDLVESGQYQAVHKVISEGRTNMAQPEAGEEAARAIEKWWRDAKGTPIRWERAWADL